MALLAVGAPPALAAQAVLNQFSSENLRATAIGLDIGSVGGTNIRGTVSYALRLDFGNVAPNVRVLLGLSYFKADLSSSALERFEQRLGDVVIDPSGDDTINLGSISWSDVTTDLDLQYILPQSRTIKAYMGLGMSLHVRSGSGPAINGTFVEDALDAVTAGLNGTLGAEFGAGHVRLAVEARGVLATGLSTIGAAMGVRYHWSLPKPTPGGGTPTK
ncbi:MAG TPA: hypothetical protein VLV16_01665 [Gemmatimonadales bacterium]|nr:hypothetical protein [Gemmatimonadales bacterium]